MNHLTGPTPTLLIAVVILLLVASLPAARVAERQQARLMPAALAPAVYLLTLIGASALIWQAFERGTVLPNTGPSRIVRYAVRELSGATERNVLVIEGGSYVLNGVSSITLKQELKKLGYDAKVVRITENGVNHLERYRMQQAIARRLSGVPRHKQRWLLLSEVHREYDRLPLAQFEENLDSSRAYAYTTPENSWVALQALKTPGVSPPPHDDYVWPLFRHTLVNAFSVGAALRYSDFEAIKPSSGEVGGRPNKRKKFKSLKRLIAEASKPAPPPTELTWLKSGREARNRRVWRRYLRKVVFFGVPNTSAAQLVHIREFCAAQRGPCIVPDVQLLRDLNDNALWVDRGHLARPGALIYSRWLALQLARAHVLAK